MRAHQHMVFSTAARILGNDRQAEDIAQETFLKAYEHFDDLRENPSAGGWLRTVARNLTFNHLGRHRKRWRLFSELRRADAEEDEPEVDFPLPDDLLAEVGSDLRHELIADALAQLPEHQRVPLVLYHFEEMRYEEIAAQLRISLAKVKVDIFRGRAALAKMLMRRGITPEVELTR